MAGLFGILDVAKSGLFAQQDSLNVTSHNISNANTPGYTRQRAELQASRPAWASPGQMGTGVDVVDIKRIRDTFLDYRIRTQTSISGKYQAQDDCLSQVQSAMNEPTETGISTLMGKFFDDWNNLGSNADNYSYKSQVAKDTETLCNNLNQTWSELEKLKKDAQDNIQMDLTTKINNKLDEIKKLNQQIREVEVTGNTPNDLMDERDNLLDDLSSEFGINIDDKQFGGIDLTTSDERDLSAKEDTSDGGDDGRPPLSADGKTSLKLVQCNNPDQACRFSYINDIQPADGQKAGSAGKYTVSYYKNGDKTSDDNKVTITVDIEDTGNVGDANYVSAADKYKKLNECRVLWADSTGTALKVDRSSNPQGILQGTIATDGGASVKFEELALFQSPSGKLKGYVSVQDHIQNGKNGYQDKLNAFAKALAFAVNATISQNSKAAVDTSTNINNFFVNSDELAQYTKDSASVDQAEKDITAGNIKINQALIDNPNLIKSATQYDDTGKEISGGSDGERALAIEQLRDRMMNINGIDNSTDKESFLKTKGNDGNNGIFRENSLLGDTPIYATIDAEDGVNLDTWFRSIITTIGSDDKAAQDNVGAQSSILYNSTQQKNSISGVSLDDEMTNLIQYQHCYQGNAKIIATIDQLLDVVVNGLRK